ncbi:MAG TPA: TetR/AcrR family transcriptional regulator [Acidimicrobiales bacterium]|nr:TetR/AcrR family transcriptional regulator [Acidimicrobiales bacterium]
MPKIVDHDERRRAIVKAARRVIGANGLQGTTVRAIAQEAGCSNGTLAHYFVNREDILTQCLLLCHRGVRDRTDIRIRAMRGLQALRILLVEALPLDEERLLEAKIEICFYGAAVGNDLLRKIQNEEVETFHLRMRRLLVQAQEDGEIGAGVDLDAMVDRCRMVVDALSVAAVMQITPPTPEIMLAHVDALLAGFSDVGVADPRRAPSLPA